VARAAAKRKDLTNDMIWKVDSDVRKHRNELRAGLITMTIKCLLLACLGGRRRGMGVV
jgi:hypothetical protein